MELSLYWLCDCVYWCPVLLILQLITDDLIEIIEANFNFLFQLLSCCGTRLSTTLDEVIVYPIPAVLYLVKNLLQVESDSCLFSVSTGSFSSCLICDFFFSIFCGSITSLLMWTHQVIRYWRTWILSALVSYTELYLRKSISFHLVSCYDGKNIVYNSLIKT